MLNNPLRELVEDNAGSVAGAAALGACMVAAVFTLSAWHRGGSNGVDESTQCTSAPPPASTLVLYDASNRLSVVNSRQAGTTVAEAALYGVGARMTVARMSGNEDRRVEIIFDRCSPGRGTEVDRREVGPTAAEAKWARTFKVPLEAAVTRLTTELVPDAKVSYLTDTIEGAVADRSLHLDGPRRQLVILSDLLEHHQGSEVYRTGTVTLAKPQTRFLDGIDVRLVELPAMPNAVRLQTPENRERWRSWLVAAGARSVTIEAPGYPS